MNLNKLKQFFLKNKKEILFFSSFMIIIFSTIDNTFANAPKEDTFIAALNWILTIASSFIAMLTALVSLLLNPGWINGTIFGFDIYLKEIWVLISNIVYFIFAFILITISFMNIVGNWAGTWELKTALPKFVVWVVMVPFTWFFVQFVLSISAFLTVAVLSLPHDVMTWNKNFDEYKKIKMCNTFVIDTVTKDKEEIEAGGKIQDSWCTKNAVDFWGTSVSLDSILSWDNSKWTSESVFWIINLYSYWIMKVDTIKELDSKIVKTVKDLSNLSIKVVIDVLFLIVYLILIIALFMALFARWVWLWIYAMFSPIFGLLFFFWKAKEWVWDKKFWVWEFIKLALVPVYVSAALAFGLLFMFVASQWLSKNNSDWGSKIFTEVVEKDVEKKSSAIDIWWFKLVMKWVVWWTWEGIMSSMGNWLWQMIIQLFWLAILWIAIMAALKSSDITGNIIKPIEEFWTSVGKLIQNSPQYAPIIPTPGGMMSSNSLWTFGRDVQSKIHSKSTEKGSALSKSMFWTDRIVDAINDSRNAQINQDNGSDEIKRSSAAAFKLLNSADITQAQFESIKKDFVSKWFMSDDFSKTYLYNERNEDSKIKLLLTELGKKANVKTAFGIDSNYSNVDIIRTDDHEDKKSNTTASGSVTESTKAEKRLKLSNLWNGVDSVNWVITQIWTVNIAQWEIPAGKYKEVATELWKNTDVKKLNKADFETEFKWFWLKDVEKIWTEIEKLRTPTP
jgi:hypothetical protein